MILGVTSALRTAGRKERTARRQSTLESLAFPGAALKTGWSSAVAPVTAPLGAAGEITGGAKKVTGDVAGMLTDALVAARTPAEVLAALQKYLGLTITGAGAE